MVYGVFCPKNMKAILLLLVLFSVKVSAQSKIDTLPCRAMFTEPWSPATNKKVHVSKFYVILHDGRPIKFLMRNRRSETDVEIWQYRLESDPKIPKQ